MSVGLLLRRVVEFSTIFVLHWARQQLGWDQLRVTSDQLLKQATALMSGTEQLCRLYMCRAEPFSRMRPFIHNV
jgi:hypothetical protein